MKTHDLKTWPVMFEPLRRRVKNFELRFDDRNFQPGDELLLREWNPVSKAYTGRYERRVITYKLSAHEFTGLQPGFCILSIH